MRVTITHVFWGTAAWVISSTACLSNDVQLIEYTGGAQLSSSGGREATAKEMPEPTGGAGTMGSGGSAAGPVNAGGTPGISAGGSGGDAETPVGTGGAGGVPTGGDAAEGGAAGALGNGGNAGGTSTCVAGPDCLTVQTRLPAPCAGIPYSELISVAGGTGLYKVQQLSAPGEFELRHEEGGGWRVASTGSSGPTTGALLEIEVTDDSSPPLEQTVRIDLSLRSSCWFAYLAEDGPSRLHFRDVFLQNDIVLPSSDVVEGVVDFKFSPDGNWLAFRVGQHPSYRLFTYDTRDPRGSASAAPVTFECPNEGEPAVPAPCGVIDYVWSRDSQHLAVVLSGTTAEQDYLSAVSGFGTEGGPGGGFAPMREAFVIDFSSDPPFRFVPLDYRGELIWLDDTQVAFWGPELAFLSPGFPEALYIGLLDPEARSVVDVFADPNQPAPAGSTLRPAERGIIELFPSDEDNATALRFFSSDASIPTVSHEAAWLSPSHRWVARRNEAGQGLALYALSDSITPMASNADGACVEVIAWSRPVRDERELLACRSAQGSSFFAFHHGEPRLEFLGSVTDDIEPGIRRGFSASGHAFVFGQSDGGANHFWQVDLTVSPPDVTRVAASFEDPPVELEFPSGRETIALSDSNLTAEFGLTFGAAGGGFTTRAAPRSACQESFSLPRWCGAPAVLDHLRYSADFRTLLVQTSERTLRIAEPPQADPGLLTDVLVPCAEGCLAPTYAFRP